MRDNWLRLRQTRLLIAGALAVSLLLGGAFLSMDQLHDRPDDALQLSVPPVMDQQSRAQAVGTAKDIVTSAGLHTTTAGYVLMSCRDRESPPYQGAVYLTFTIPAETRADVYLPEVANALRTHGWTEGQAPGNHAYARTFTRDAVTAMVYRHDDNPALGILRLYGECRNVNNHRTDPTAWIDVTAEVS